MTTCIVCGTRIQHGSRCKDHTYRNGSGAGWRNLRTLILQRDGYRCTWTTKQGERCQVDTNLHVDHIVPMRLGGFEDPTNLRTLCSTHNLQKGGA